MRFPLNEYISLSLYKYAGASLFIHLIKLMEHHECSVRERWNEKKSEKEENNQVSSRLVHWREELCFSREKSLLSFFDIKRFPLRVL